MLLGTQLAPAIGLCEPFDGIEFVADAWRPASSSTPVSTIRPVRSASSPTGSVSARAVCTNAGLCLAKRPRVMVTWRARL